MKIFVTGGTGFIGSHFIKQALHQGHEVHALRRPDSHPRIVLPQQPTWIDSSLDNVLPAAISPCDILVHAAAYGVSPQRCGWMEALQVNVLDSMALVHAASIAEVQRFIVVGSCVEYGNLESEVAPIASTSPLNPIGAYAGSKAAFTKAFTAFVRENSLKAAVLRLFQVFGDGQYSENFWPSLRRAALAGDDFRMTSGKQIRDFTPVEFAATQILDIATSLDLTPGRPVFRNIGTGRPQQLREFAAFWWRQWQASGRIIFGEIPDRPNEVMYYIPELTNDHKQADLII